MQFVAIMALVGKLLDVVGLVPVDAKDALIDAIEKNNHDNKIAMAACQVLRTILSVPDEPDEDQQNPV